MICENYSVFFGGPVRHFLKIWQEGKANTVRRESRVFHVHHVSAK